MEQTINANLNQCIQSTNSIGGNTFYNVCTGSTYWVPWGSLDWIGAISLTLLCALFVSMGLFFIYIMARG